MVNADVMTKADVEALISMDRTAVRILLLAGAVFLVLGAAVGLGIGGQLFGGQGEFLELAEKSAGVVSSIVGLYPFNLCWQRWQRLKQLEVLRSNPNLIEPATMRELLGSLVRQNLGV